MNSIIKQVYKSATPEVGTPATFCGYSDRNPGQVSEIISPKAIRVTSIDAKVIGGPYEYGDYMEYEFFPLTLEELKTAGGRIFTQRKNGNWVAKGCKMNEGTTAMLGSYDKYRDPSF